jgi:hypothetical protein
MWDLTPMSIFINYSLCELFISSQYGTGVLQSSQSSEAEDSWLSVDRVKWWGVSFQSSEEEDSWVSVDSDKVKRWGVSSQSSEEEDSWVSVDSDKVKWWGVSSQSSEEEDSWVLVDSLIRGEVMGNRINGEDSLHLFIKKWYSCLFTFS